MFSAISTDTLGTPLTRAWHWTYLNSLHRHCEGILQDYTLLDPDGNPPPKSIWFDEDEKKLWREDMEKQRDIEAKKKASRND